MNGNQAQVGEGSRRMAAAWFRIYGILALTVGAWLLVRAISSPIGESRGGGGRCAVGPPGWVFDAAWVAVLLVLALGLIASALLHFFAGRSYLRTSKTTFIGVICILDAVFWALAALTLGALFGLWAVALMAVLCLTHIHAATLFMRPPAVPA